jgi:palmitoyltransferase
LFPLVVPPSSNGWAYPRRQLPEDAHTAPARSSKPGGPEALSLTGSLHSPELMEGLLSPQGGGMAENGHGSGSRYVMGDDGGLTDDEEGGGGFMDY